jgi:hypothetical protein
MDTAVTPRYEARFCSLFNDGRALAFPCDAHGKVNLDGLTDRARTNYLYARALMGREFAAPVVMPCRESRVQPEL